MNIQSMFQKPINRDINGVIKVTQNDDRSLFQELDEYIITKELRRHFGTFFDNYEKAINHPTDKIGVWISGFFGSGKSHFLKMLSYLLSNRHVAGRRAVDFFKYKFDDPIMYATIVRCTNIPTESILFNIDVEDFDKVKKAVLRVFAKMFYNHLGFYGEDLKVARLERYIDRCGKADAFRKAFEEVNGKSWAESRASWAFLEDNIVSVMRRVLDMSETAARNWFNNEEIHISTKLLVEEIKEYVDGKGDDFRLLFCVDEVGQYIGDDGERMLNLQSIVEELGSKCNGKVWVMLTSQEDIDTVINVRGNDFSKIQGRFNTRVSISSVSVDEVIKKRILEKTVDANMLLQSVYDKERAVLKNLFTFNTDVLDIKGYTDGAEFSATYPFVPYQFIIIQKVLTEIRTHGNSGKHLSDGARSILSGFQDAAKRVLENDENTLVPFSLFYDAVHDVLESKIRRVIDRCQTAADNKHYGLEHYDVSILKLLYLVRYINDIKANIDNIAILMIDNIHVDKIKLRGEITESLERLERQNYVARNGDNYFFLTDEEQEIAVDIRKTTVDSTTIVFSIGQTIFNEIYSSKKYKYNKWYDFAYNQYVDGTRFGTDTGEVRLRFVTEVNDYYDAPDRLILDSSFNKEVIVQLARDVQYFKELEDAAKINKYINTKNVSQLSVSIQKIISDKRTQALTLENKAKKQIEKAIVDAVFYVNGRKIDTTKYGDAKGKLDEALKQLIESVYSKLNFVNTFCESDADILTILNGKPQQGGFAGTGSNNEFALNEVNQWLEERYVNRVPISMGDIQRRYQAIPYGWREVDIAALVARLIVSQKIEVRYGGAVVGKDDKNLLRYLRMKSEIDKVSVNRRIAPSGMDMQKAIKFLRDWLGQMDIADDEDGLLTFIKDTLIDKKNHYDGLLAKYNNHNDYPQKEVVITANKLIADILSKKNDNVALLKQLIAKQDDLLDLTDDMEEINTFFRSQKTIFDAAQKLQCDLQNERDYFVENTEMINKISEISNILGMPKPYSRIKDLPDLMQAIKTTHSTLLSQKKEEVIDIIRQCMDDVHKLSGVDSKATYEINKSDDRFTEYKQNVDDATSLTVLDAIITRIRNYKDQVCQRVECMLCEDSTQDNADGDKHKPRKVVRVNRHDVFPVKLLTTHEDVDGYLDDVRKKLYDTLDANGGIQIN